MPTKDYVEKAEWTRLADVLARDAAHTQTLALMAGAIATGIVKVAAVTGDVWTAHSAANKLAADLRELAHQLQEQADNYRTRV